MVHNRCMLCFAYGSNMNAVRLFEDRLKPEGVAGGERIAGRLDGWRRYGRQGHDRRDGRNRNDLRRGRRRLSLRR